MTCLGDISDMLRQTIYVARCCGVNEAGELDYGSPVEIKALVQRSDRFVEGSGVTENVTGHEIYTLEAVGEQDLIWLPNSNHKDRCEARMPKNVDPCFDPEIGEISHYEVLV